MIKPASTFSARLSAHLAASLATPIALALALGLSACKEQPAAAVASEAPQASALSVQLAQVQTQVWPDQIRANGPIEAWQEIIVSPETSGLRLAELVVDVGAKVKRGDLLARLADASPRADLHKQQGLANQAQANLTKASSNLARAKATGNSGVYSAQQLEELQLNLTVAEAAYQSALADLDNAKLKLAHTRITAAEDGLVTAKSGVLGTVVSSGTEIFRMIRQGKLEWRPEVDAQQLASIHPGQTAMLSLPGGAQVEGQVRLTSPAVDPHTGRAVIYVSLGADSPARAGMFASGSIAFASRESVSLPRSALVMRDGRAYVWRVDGSNRVSSQLVTTGRSQGDRVEILAGLDSAARVVAAGGAFLSEGATVSISSAELAARQQVSAP